MNFCICIPCVTTTQTKTYISSTIGSFICRILVSSPSPKGALYSDLHHHRLILSDSELHKNWNHAVYTLRVWFLSCNIIICEIQPCLYIPLHSHIYFFLYLQRRKLLLLYTLKLYSPIKMKDSCWISQPFRWSSVMIYKMYIMALQNESIS